MTESANREEGAAHAISGQDSEGASFVERSGFRRLARTATMPVISGARDASGFAILSVATLALVSVVSAWTLRFLHDAAYISFHYARAWSEGGGLTWFGERVEGYTNFLWVVWLRLAFDLGIDPALWAHVGGAISLATAIVAVFRMGRIVFENEGTALLAAIIFACNFSVLALAVSGSETLLQTCLLAWVVLLSLECYYDARCSAPRALGLSLLMTLALLTRMDSIVIVSPAILIALAGISRASGTPRQYIALFAPVVGISAAWLIWRYGYYGMVVPNTFNAWIDPDLSMLGNGLAYAWQFQSDYLIWPLALAAILVMVIWRIRLAPRLGFIMVLGAAWSMYVILIGGDYLEYRFLVPGMPMLALILAFAVEAIVTPLPGFRTPAAILISLAYIAASVLHGVSFEGKRGTIESIRALSTGGGLYPTGDWDRIGAKLGSDLRGVPVTVATQYPGAIAYYSRIRTHDMWGLNNRYVADFGVRAPEWWLRPGQRRMTTLTRMREEGVTFVISDPTILQPPTLATQGGEDVVHRWLESTIPFSHTVVDSATIVVMPLGRDEGMLMWYLTESPEVTARIRERGWLVQTMRFPSVPSP